MRSSMRFACAVALCLVLASGVNARTLQQKQKPVSCPNAPPEVDYNTWPDDCKDKPLGFACKGDCALGYTGSPTAVCQKKHWAANGACKPATCSNTLPDIANATWEACVDSPVGTLCTAKCDGYFTESGPINSTCTGIIKGATWSTPSEYCGIINSQATLTIEAAVAGGVCSDAATAAVKSSVEGFMSAQSVAELSVHVICYNADGTSTSARRLQEDAPLNVRYVILVVYIGGEAAAQTLVDTAQTDLAQINDLIASVANATGGAVTVQQEGVTGDVSGGGNPVLNPEQEAKVSLLRSGPAPNIQSNTSFYLTAVYTGSAGVALAGITISGPTISPSDAVTCTPLNAAPLTDGAGIASWSCVTGPTGTNVTISVTAPHPSGDTVSDSVAFTVGTDCVGDFTPFGTCSNVCGQGEYSRTFNVATPAENGGRACLFANGFVQTENCTGPITCGECSSCGVSACVDLAAGTDCSQQGKCYNGICQPGAKIFDVKSISPVGTFPANNTEWIWLRYTTTSPNAALAQFVNLADEAGRTTVPLGMTASVTNAVLTGAPEDPRSPGCNLTSALLMINPQGFAPPTVPVAEPLDKVEAALYFVNNTVDHPIGMFNGMKFKDLVDNNFTVSFSWYRGSYQNMTVGSAPIFRFTISNPAQVPIPRGVQFVWEPAYNLVAGVVPTNTWRNEVVNLNQGALSVWMGSYAGSASFYGANGINCYQPLSWWMTSTTKCGTGAAAKTHPWFASYSTTLFGTDNLFRDGVITDIRVQALNPRTLVYANNFKISTSNGYSFTYVFTT